MNFGRCNLPFSTIAGMDKAIAFLLSLPKPTRGYRSSYAEESPTYIKADKDLICSDFNIKADKWVRLVQDALDHAGIKYEPVESLKSGQYTNDVFMIGDYAVYVCCLKRGGRGVLVCDKQHVAYMRDDDKTTRAKTSERAKVLSTLTIEQRRALGI
jgi:hypothetical protein